MAEKTDHDMLVEVHAVLLGTNGHKGLCQDFEEHKADDKKFRNIFYKFRLWIIIVVIILATACGFTVPEVIKAVAGA